MIPWAVQGLHDSDYFMGCPLKSQGFGEVLPFVHTEAEAEKEFSLASTPCIGGGEQIVCNLLPIYTCVLGAR